MDDTKKTHRRRRRGLLALLLAGTALISTAGATLSLAQFTSTPTPLTTSFGTGSIILQTSPAAVFTVVGMMPGDIVQSVVTVKNNGTGALRYSMTTATVVDPDLLLGQLAVTIAPTTTSCTVGVGTALTGVGTTMANVKIGDPTQGQQGVPATGGDRTLASGDTELLCFTVTLPLATGNTYQLATASETLNFFGEQTINNP